MDRPEQEIGRQRRTSASDVVKGHIERTGGSVRHQETFRCANTTEALGSAAWLEM